MEARITIKDPANKVLVAYQPMINNISIQEHQYTLRHTNTSLLGTYDYCISANVTGQNKTSCFNFQITPTGETNLLGFFILIILIVYGIIVFGVWKQDITITLLGTFAMYFLGIYMLFFGLDIIKNYLTDAFAIITLGIAGYFSIRMAMEYMDI